MNLGFLTAAAAEGAVARSQMEGQTAAAGARFELRDGWNVAVEIPAAGNTAETVGWADVSHLRKLELQGSSAALEAAATTALPLGTAVRRDGAWWCRLSQTRALVLGGGATPELGSGLELVDVTSKYAALTIAGPQARETFARFCALDLRERVTPVHALRPGSIGRQPGILIREAEQRYLFLFGSATAEYMWSVVADAGAQLGGHPLGVDQLAAFPIPDTATEPARA